MKLKKIKKFAYQHRYIIIVVSLILIVAMYLYFKKSPDTTARIGGGKYRIKDKRTFDAAKVYKMIMLTDDAFWAARCKAIAAAGFDCVQLVIPISETWNALGSYNFDRYIELANVALDNGLHLVLKPHVGILPKLLGNYFQKSDMMVGPGGNQVVDNHYQPSFSSEKWNGIKAWARACAVAFQPFQDAGYVVAVFPSASDSQELCYSLPYYGDRSPAELAASGNIDQSTVAYARFQTNAIKRRLDEFCEAFLGYRMGWDASAVTYNWHKFAGTYDYMKVTQNPAVKFFKINLGARTDSEYFNVGLQYDWKVQKQGYYCTEWTNEPAQWQNGNVASTAQYLSDMHRISIDNGCNLLSFAFHSPDKDGGGAAFQMAKEVKAMLVNTGHWSKPVTTPERVGEVFYSFENIFNSDGWNTPTIKGAFDAARAANGGKIPNVRCTG